MSKSLAKFLSMVVRGVLAIQHGQRAEITRVLTMKSLEVRVPVETRHGPLVMLADHPQNLDMARKYFDREPETFAWIDSFEAGSVFWDIGANIGEFTLYAALRGDLRVLAFEPAAANYALLNRNLTANGLTDRAMAYPIAFSDMTGLGALHLSAANAGSVGNAFGTRDTSMGHRLEHANTQGAVGCSVDAFIDLFEAPMPNHLKIDVDSIEEQILLGAQKCLADRRLQSVLLEFTPHDTARNARMTDLITRHGFADSGEGGNAGTPEYPGINKIFRRS